MKASSLIARIENTAPLSHAASWDRSGVQIAGTRENIRRMAVCLDPTRGSIESAAEQDVDFILCHHPLTLSPRLPDRVDDYHHILRTILGRGCWLYAAHTSLDAQPQGPVSWLARELRLENTRILQPTGSHGRVSISLPRVDRLSSEELRQFGPNLFSEMREGGHFQSAVTEQEWPSLRRFLEQRDIPYLATPVAEPRSDYGFGSVGDLPTPLPAREFKDLIAEQLQLPVKAQTGPLPERISRVAYCPGSGADLAGRAFAAGADIYITGDLKYHQAQDAEGVIMDVGHFSLEERMMVVWESELRQELAPEKIETIFIPGKDPLTP